MNIAELEAKAKAVCALPDHECVTRADNQIVCDYLTASNATDILALIARLREAEWLLSQAVINGLPFHTPEYEEAKAFLAKDKP